MKKTKLILQLSLYMLSLVACTDKILAQDADTNSEQTSMQNKLNSKKYVFTAQSVTPSRGNFRQLTTSYDVRVSGDSVICNLPYFGRAYTAPIDPSSGGFNFVSTANDYKLATRKKRGWEITIKPQDYRDVQQIFLTVFDNGSATLQVTSNNRQPIMFNGYVK